MYLTAILGVLLMVYAVDAEPLSLMLWLEAVGVVVAVSSGIAINKHEARREVGQEALMAAIRRHEQEEQDFRHMMDTLEGAYDEPGRTLPQAQEEVRHE